MTRLEFFQNVVAQLTQGPGVRYRGSLLAFLEREKRSSDLEDVLLCPKDLLVMSAALAQCELVATGRTYLARDPIPRNPAEATLHFFVVSQRVTTATRRLSWALLMWAALAPFKHQRPRWGSA